MTAPSVNKTIDAGRQGGQAILDELYRLWMHQTFSTVSEKADHQHAFHNFFEGVGVR